MKKYCIVEQNSHEHHAGSKARNDAGSILIDNSYISLTVHHSNQGGITDKLAMSAHTVNDWRRISSRLKPGDILLIQYPLAMYPKVSMLSVPFLKHIRKKGVHTILLIHDLDSLRGFHFKHEDAFLSLSDGIIFQNARMKRFVLKKGYRFKHMYTLGLFDYLSFGYRPAKSHYVSPLTEVAIAGNLSLEKAGYLKKLHNVKGIDFTLYGPNLNKKVLSDHITYAGSFPPEELPCKISASWGLVWDGDTINTCSGSHGIYLKYNNPHKASLYLACGIPLIVWDKSAIAEYVVSHRLGIAVSSLFELSDRLKAVSLDEYKNLKAFAAIKGNELLNGSSLKHVLKEIDNDIIGGRYV